MAEQQNQNATIQQLQWEMNAMKERAREREQENKERDQENEARIVALEKRVQDMATERAKWGGMFILAISAGSVVLWLTTVGSNLKKVLAP